MMGMMGLPACGFEHSSEDDDHDNLKHDHGAPEHGVSVSPT
jgi:hypothetical protein